jgi:hypothetical protein
MNVTVTLPDDFIMQARVCAVQDSSSLSAWLANLVRHELEQVSTNDGVHRSLAEAMHIPEMPEDYYQKNSVLHVFVRSQMNWRV